jgi:hypothetical protein
MVPYMLSNDALFGRVVKVDHEHREQGPVRMVSRPLVTVEIAEPCAMPVGKELYWTKTPNAAEYVLAAVEPAKGGRPARVVLAHQTSSNQVERPPVGAEVTFSIHHKGRSPPLMLPSTRPWTHDMKTSQAEQPIEDNEGGWE